jgi:nucleoside-diphosphate-sugar epimerase
MRILVTGGTGFIGSHIVDQLLALGQEVEVVDDLSSGEERTWRAASRSTRSMSATGNHSRKCSIGSGPKPCAIRRHKCP